MLAVRGAAHVYDVPVTSALTMSDPPDAEPIIILYVVAPVLAQLKVIVLLVMATCCKVIVNELGAD